MMRLLSLILASTALATPAFAHTGIGDTNGFAHGFLHPVSGIDHVLAMVAVGLFAALLGGRAIWLVPLAFVTMMGAGGAAGVAGINPPLTEIGIGLSVVALGVAVAFSVRMPVAAAMAFVGFIAIFHGQAHGAEMPETASGLAYGIGLIIATALLLVCGIGIGLWLGRVAQDRVRRVTQLAGGAMSLAGIGILVGVIG
jgi:urease accessory protein